jgi:predicted Zn finger-like uncharacterized protein
MVTICPHCGNEFYIRDELAGKKVRCHKCKKQVEAPAKAAASEDEAGEITTEHDLRSAAKTKPDKKTKSSTGGKESKRKTRVINLHRGFRRLALIVSVALGPVVFILMVIPDDYTLEAYLASAKSVYTFDTYLDRITSAILDFLILWVIGFAIAWVVYGAISFIVSGFLDTSGARKKGRT